MISKKSTSMPPPHAIDLPLPPDETTTTKDEKIPSILWDGTTYTRELIKKAFPKVMGNIELSWRNDGDTYGTFNVLNLGLTITVDEDGNIIQK